MAGESFHNQGAYVCYFVGHAQSKFTNKTGGDSNNEVTQVISGGGNTVNVDGPPKVGEVQLQKPYDPIRDASLVAWDRRWQKGVREPLTLIVQHVTSEGIPAGEPDMYIQCSRRSFKKPDVQTDSSSPAMLDITVQPTDKL